MFLQSYIADILLFCLAYAILVVCWPVVKARCCETDTLHPFGDRSTTATLNVHSCVDLLWVFFYVLFLFTFTPIKDPEDQRVTMRLKNVIIHPFFKNKTKERFINDTTDMRTINSLTSLCVQGWKAWVMKQGKLLQTPTVHFLVPGTVML